MQTLGRDSNSCLVYFLQKHRCLWNSILLVHFQLSNESIFLNRHEYALEMHTSELMCHSRLCQEPTYLWKHLSRFTCSISAVAAFCYRNLLWVTNEDLTTSQFQLIFLLKTPINAVPGSSYNLSLNKSQSLGEIDLSKSVCVRILSYCVCVFFLLLQEQ